MPFDIPLKLGPFIIDPHGRLCPSTPDCFPAFRFTCHDTVVHANLGSVGEAKGTLVLRAVLGRVSSTGRTPGGTSADRPSAFATLRALPALLPDGWKVKLMPDHRIAAEAHVPLTLPTLAVDLLSELTLFVMRLAPYLDLLAEGAGVEAAGPEAAAADGSANT